MKKREKSCKVLLFIFIITLVMNFSYKEVFALANDTNIYYKAHVQDIGWQDWVNSGELAGTTGQAKKVEALKIDIKNLPEGVVLKYRTHVSDIGWQDWVNNGELAGTTGQNKAVEAVEIRLEGVESDYHIEYRTHVSDIGWQGWVRDGELAGTTGQAKKVEAIQIKLVKNDNVKVGTLLSQSHVSNEGWNSWKDSKIATGSSINNVIEGVKLKFNDSVGIGIEYNVYVESEGWQGWKRDGELAGTTGENKKIRAIKVRVNNSPGEYKLQYRTNIKNGGWQPWVSEGEISGKLEFGEGITAIQVRYEKQYSKPNVKYQAHVSDIGWQNRVSNGVTAGTTGQNKAVESIKINMENLPSDIKLTYKAHVRDEGWQVLKENGQEMGTTGKARAIEAIIINITREIPGYNFVYRAHVQDIGWQEWKRSGEVAGTTGQAKSVEAIEIKFVPKKNKTIVIDPGHNYGGDDGAYATHGGILYSERDLNMSTSMKLKTELEAKGYDVILTRKSEDREMLSVAESLKRRVEIANDSKADFFISIHQNSFTSPAAKGFEVFYSSATPLSGGRILINGEEYNLEAHSKSSSDNYKVGTSKNLALNILNSVSSKMPMNKRKVEDKAFYVVKNTYMPSVLVECGFITNPSEAKDLADERNQLKKMSIIAEEINKVI